MELKLFNYYFGSLEKALNVPNPDFPTGRSKMKIIKLFGEKMQFIETSRLEILNSLCEKDEKGEKKMVDGVNKKGQPTKNFDLTPENLAKYNEEYAKLMQEECIIDIPDSMRHDLSVVKGMLSTSQAQGLGDGDILVIDETIKAMEWPEPAPQPGAVKSPLSPKKD